MDTKKALTKILQFRDERDWKQFHTSKEIALALLIEAGELAEHFQWKTGEELKEHTKEKKQAISHELADVLYWLILLSHELKIDIEKAFSEKMKINASKYPIEDSYANNSKYNDKG